MSAIEARDIIFGVVKTYCDGKSLTVEWPDQPFEKPNSTAYAKASMRHATGRQAALTPVGQKLWESAGVASVTFYCPIASGLVNGYTLAQDMISALRTSNAAVWFRNVRIRELGSEGGYNLTQVLWDFEYRDQE